MYEKLLVTFTFQKFRYALWEKSSETSFKKKGNKWLPTDMLFSLFLLNFKMD